MSCSPNPGGKERWSLLDIGEKMEFKNGYLPEANSESDPPDLPITKMEIQRGAVTSLDYLFGRRTETEALTSSLQVQGYSWFTILSFLSSEPSSITFHQSTHL